MGRRLGFGFLKGLLIGATIGAVTQAGLGWTAPGLLGYLFSAATGATAGVVCGKAPWKQEAWLEGVLKAVAGHLFGAGAFWGLGTLSGNLGFELFGAGADVPWNEQPLLFAPLIAGAFGSLIELDNTEGNSSHTKKQTTSNARTGTGVEDVETILAEPDSAKTKPKKNRTSRR